MPGREKTIGTARDINITDKEYIPGKDYLCNRYSDRCMITDGMRAALFDLDGVVFDTEPQYTIFWGEQFKRYYPDRPGLEQEIKGQTLTQIFDRYFGGDLECERRAVTQRLDEYELSMRFPYIPGFIKYIEQLRSHGVKTALVTSSNNVKMAVVYRRRPELKGLFDAILTSEDFERSKPDPDCYLKAARRLGADVADCVVYEDSFNGLRAGCAAGMRVVGLATSNPAEKIRELCDAVIGDYTEWVVMS